MPSALIANAFAFKARVADGFIPLILSDRSMILSLNRSAPKRRAFFLDLRGPRQYKY
jgi:hypothetical protein